MWNQKRLSFFGQIVYEIKYLYRKLRKQVCFYWDEMLWKFKRIMEVFICFKLKLENIQTIKDKNPCAIIGKIKLSKSIFSVYIKQTNNFPRRWSLKISQKALELRVSDYLFSPIELSPLKYFGLGLYSSMHIPGSKFQLCKGSSAWIWLRRYMDRRTGWFLCTPRNFVWGRYNNRKT